MKIILTGASGLLGSAFARSAKRRKHQIIGIVGKHKGCIEGLSEQISLDLENRAELERIVLAQFPDAIVNCAAASDPAVCETNPNATRALNIELPEQLALLSRHLFATFINISSEQVFNGAKDIYTTADTPSPINEYARQKLEAEKRVHELANEFATTLRLPLLMGNSPSGTRSIHERLFAAWERGETTTLFTDEIRQPCLSDNAADAMVELCERSDLKGIYNWAGGEPVSRFEIGQAILKRFGLPDNLISSSTRGDAPKFANRQPRLTFDLTSLSGKMKTQPQRLETQIDALIVPKPRRTWYNAI